jgi:hypothetical protein
MKTSKKILLYVAGFILVLLIIYVEILRNTVQSVRSKTEIKNNYRTVSVGDFEKLDFSSHMNVRIRQGKDCKVEYNAEKDSVLKPICQNINGTLYIKADSSEKAVSIQLRIIMPSLLALKAAQGTEIHLENFASDSLSVILENGCAFTGNVSKIRHTSFKTSGDAMLNITNSN